jgi:hypothetical protein
MEIKRWMYIPIVAVIVLITIMVIFGPTWYGFQNDEGTIPSPGFILIVAAFLPQLLIPY